MSYASEVLERISKENPGEQEFLQAAKEVLLSLTPALKAREEQYRRSALLERLLNPERQLKFRVPWIDDRGQAQVNTGYRVQFNSAIGPYKGGLRLHPSVNLSIIKFLGFEQIFKNALTGLSIGGGKGGADFDPKGKSEREIMAFCQSYMTELYRYIGAEADIPAGDIGTGEREIGYLFGQYKRIKGVFEGALTGKGLSYGGSRIRNEATGYGLIYITEEMLRSRGHQLKDKRIAVSGAGNVAIYAIEKVHQLGATAVTVSDSDGWIHAPGGIDLTALKKIKEEQRGRLKDYPKLCPEAKYYEGQDLWAAPCDIALPCATQNELDLKDAKNLADNGVLAVAEGANMPCAPEAVEYFHQNGIYFLPGKAANAGGVAVSALEMAQNSLFMAWSEQKVDRLLQEIMGEIFQKIDKAAKRYQLENNWAAGANLAGFERIAEAMCAQGIL